MTATGAEPLVVDCQSHWHPREFFEALARRDRPPRATRAPDGGYVVELGEATRFPIMPLLLDLDRQLEDAAAAGIDVVVSSTGAFGVEDLPAAEAGELAALLNEATRAAERAHPGRFHGLARVPLQSPEAALEVLDHAIGELGLRGVCICSNVGGRSVADPDLWPVYERIEALGVPLFIHPTRTPHSDELERYGLEYVVGFMFDSTIAALDLAFSGAMERFPGLEVVHPHLGGTIPFLAGRIDYEYRKPWAMDTTLSRPPTEYLRRFHTDTVSQTPGALALALDFYGPERMLFASDYPYWSPAEELAFVRANVPAGHLDRVLAGNACRLLGLDRPAPGGAAGAAA